MLGDPRDAWAYRIAVGALGLALLTVLIGSIVIVIVGETTTPTASTAVSASNTATTSKIRGGSKSVKVSKTATTTYPQTTSTAVTPTGLYAIGGVLAGALLGILLPLPWPSRLPRPEGNAPKPNSDTIAAVLTGVFVGALVLVFVATVSVGVVEGLVTLEVLGAASGGVLLGLCVPSPATRR